MLNLSIKLARTDRGQSYASAEPLSTWPHAPAGESAARQGIYVSDLPGVATPSPPPLAPTTTSRLRGWDWQRPTFDQLPIRHRLTGRRLLLPRGAASSCVGRVLTHTLLPAVARLLRSRFCRSLFRCGRSLEMKCGNQRRHQRSPGLVRQTDSILKLRLATFCYKTTQRGAQGGFPCKGWTASQSSNAVLGAKAYCLFLGDRCPRRLSDPRQCTSATHESFLLSRSNYREKLEESH